MKPVITANPLTHCPSCGVLLQLRINVKSIDIVEREAQQAVETVHVEKESLEKESPEHEVIRAAKLAGLLDPFFQAVSYVKQMQMPKDIHVFFLTFTQTLTQRSIPQQAMDIFNDLFGHRPLKYYSAQGIGVVVVDGYMRLFVPNSEVVGTRLRQIGGHNAPARLKIDDGAPKLREWIKTRWGYVEGDGALYDTLHNKSFGAFALPNLSAPNQHNT